MEHLVILDRYAYVLFLIITFFWSTECTLVGSNLIKWSAVRSRSSPSAGTSSPPSTATSSSMTSWAVPGRYTKHTYVELREVVAICINQGFQNILWIPSVFQISMYSNFFLFLFINKKRFCIRFPCNISFGVKGITLKYASLTLYREILHLTVVTDDSEALSEALSCRGEENNLSSKTK